MASATNIQDKNLVLIACCLVFITSATFCIVSGEQTRWPDESIYLGIAERLAAGLGFVNPALQPSAFRPPAYPFVLSLLHRIDESVLLAKLVNAVALAATAWLLSRIVETVAPQGRFFAPLLVLAYPLFIFTSGILVPQILGGLLFVLALCVLVRCPKSIAPALGCGTVFGILILLIPSFALVFVCLSALLLLANRIAGLYSLKFIAVFCLATALTVAPWIVRSSLLFERFVFISTNSGINLLFGNSENTGYDTGVVDVSQHRPPKGVNEAEADAYFKQAAIAWIKNHPADAAVLYLQKTANYFNYKNKLGNSSEESRFKNAVMFLSYYPLLLMALLRCGMWRRFRFTWPELLLYSLYFGNAFLSAIVYTRIRYRIPFDFLLIAIVCIFIGYLRTARAGKTL